MGDTDTTTTDITADNPNAGGTISATVSLDIKGICDAVSDRIDIAALREGVLEDLDITEHLENYDFNRLREGVLADMVEEALDVDSIAEATIDALDGDYRLDSMIESGIENYGALTSDDLGPAIEEHLDMKGLCSDVARYLEDNGHLEPGVSGDRVQDIENDVTKLEEAVFGSNEEGCVVVTNLNFLAVLRDTVSQPLSAALFVAAFDRGIKALVDANNRQAQTIQGLTDEVEVLKGQWVTPPSGSLGHPTPTE